MARVLLIEEDTELADVLRELLENNGSYVVIADDPAACARQPFDLAVVSLSSPGDSTISDLRARWIDLKIVGLVADSRDHYESGAADSVLHKPFDVRELLTIVERLSREPMH